jgi:hypothetical protein
MTTRLQNTRRPLLVVVLNSSSSSDVHNQQEGACNGAEAAPADEAYFFLPVAEGRLL